MITNEMINEIRNKLDIIEIVSNYVPLTQRGKNYFGVCPFHDDHSPSMSVSQEKQIYTCFSCGATGNVFTFVADYEHIGFYDAVRLLGNKVGFNLDTSKSIKSKEKDDAREIYDLACRFYQNSLNTALGKNAIEYLDDRKIDKEARNKFRIGLSMSKVSLTDYLLNKNYSLDKLIKLGISTDNGSDLFVNRIMFPLYDLQGNVVAFSGRIYNTKDQSKYVNTKETEIFKKGNLLYNYHLARDVLKKNESIIVMEGFMDVIRASTVGINNCVATMGTAFTKQHAQLLKKTSNSIILMFDGDEAGEEATEKAIEVLKEVDITPKVVRLPEGLDPDEYILKYGGEDFKQKLISPESAIEFMMRLHRANKNMADINDISRYVNEALKDLISCEDEILINLTLKKIETEFRIDYDLLKDKLLSLKKKQNKSKSEEVIKVNKKYDRYSQASRHLLYYMLKSEEVIRRVEEEVIYFPDTNIRILASEMIYYYHKYGILKVADFISYIADKEELVKTFNEIIRMDIKEEYSEVEIDDYINGVNAYPVRKKVADLNKQLQEETDPIKKASILSEKLALKGVK